MFVGLRVFSVGMFAASQVLLSYVYLIFTGRLTHRYYSFQVALYYTVRVRLFFSHFLY
jgi:hypothetical protein